MSRSLMEPDPGMPPPSLRELVVRGLWLVVLILVVILVAANS